MSYALLQNSRMRRALSWTTGLLWMSLASVLHAERAALRPTIVPSHVPFGPARVAQMEAYSLRHSGDATAVLTPRAIVLHYTCGPSYASTWSTFASNSAHHREPPGVCAHYVIDFDGTIHELVPTTLRCRHTVGLNHVAIGIEFVQPCVRSARRAEQMILEREAQMRAGLLLVRELRRRFHIDRENILGHAMANQHPLFVDLTGQRNDHGDWRPGAVRTFLERLDALSAERNPSR